MRNVVRTLNFYMKDNFTNQAAIYAQFRPTYPSELFDFILQNVDNKGIAWDCATGNGQAAHILADYFERVEATDISQKQLDNAVQKVNIHYSLQAAENTIFQDNSFDLITIAQAIHWFNFNAFYDEIQRVAKPNALIAIWGYGTLTFENTALNQLFLHYYQHIIGPFWDKERRHIDNHYADIPFPFAALTPPQYALCFEWSQTQFEGYLQSWSSLKHYKNAHNGHNPIPDLMALMAPNWAKKDIKIVHFPIFSKFGHLLK
jgi:Methyltransferase domain